MASFVLRSAAPLAVAALLAMTAPLASALAADGKDDPVVAKVDGQDIHRSTILEMKDRLSQQMPQLQAMPMTAIFPGLQGRAVDQALLLSEAKKAGLEKDKEVKEQLARLQDELMQRAYLSRQVEQQITDDKLHAAYDDYIKSMPPGDEVHARHILLDSEDKAKAVLKKLKGGASFADLANSESMDRGNKNGGDLGYFTKEAMVPEFAEAAFAMAVGEVSKAPVKSQFGWHIIKVEDRRKVTPPTFDQAKEGLRGQVADSIIQETVKSLRSKAKIELFDLDGKPVAAEPAKVEPSK